METLDEVHQTKRDEYGLKADSLLAALEKFSTLFGLNLGYLLFGASETLSKSLQGKDTTLQKALLSVNLTKVFYMRQRTDPLSLTSTRILQLTKILVNQSFLDTEHQQDSTKEVSLIGLERQRMITAICTLSPVTCLFESWRIDSQVKEYLSPVLSLENLLQVANGESYDDDLKSLQSTCYRENINLEQLQKQLPLLVDIIRQALSKVSRVTSVQTICEAMNTQNVYKSMLAEVHNLFRLYFTVLITSATSEKTFSALRRILTYLRSSMSEQRLNNCMLLHIHKDFTDACDIKQVVNSEKRYYFGRF